jgi:Zn-dependent protease with chaperone function
LFVIGHELGHARREHTSWHLLTSHRRTITAPIVQDLLRLIFNRWLVKAEYTADRAGLLACRDLAHAVSALGKVHFWGQQVDVERFIKDLNSVSQEPLVRIGEYFSDHPYFTNRITQLKSFHDDLVRRGVL